MLGKINFNAKIVGIILIALSIVLAVIFYSTTVQVGQSTTLECKALGLHPADVSCPHEKNIPLETYAGFTISLIVAVIGLLLFLNAGGIGKVITEKENNLDKIISSLEEDEKKIAAMLKNSGNLMFQSELVEKTGHTKVKMTRILDKLEAKGLIERRRKGMTNLVFLK